jgi:hypothetical protein
METFKQRFRQNKQQQLEKKVLNITRLQKIAKVEGKEEKVVFYTKKLSNLKNRIESLKA